uniref:YjjA family protein n=1 Tax=Halomonas sp. TaxID=1486246 RepID=UPI00262EA3C7|nr:YjjA family protein [Halomonas sp.]
MDTRLKTIAFAGLLGFMSIGQAQALSFDSVKESASSMLSEGGGEGGGLLSSLSSGSFSSGSLTNLTGVINYCQEKGYLGSTADVAKDQLMEQLGVSAEPTEDSDYQQGLSGILQGEDGESFNLASLGDTVGEKACGMVADQAVSMVGG